MDKAATLSSPLWEEGKKIFYDELGDKRREKIKDSSTLEDTLETLRIASTRASKEYGEHSIRKDKKPIITIQLSKIMSRLEVLAQMGDTYMECAPETVSLVWMSFRMIFTGFLRDAETCAYLTDIVDQISDIIFVCSVLERRYEDTTGLPSGAGEMKGRILARIPPLYAAVLKFSYQSQKLFKHDKLVRSLMPWRSQELQDTLTDAQNKRRGLQETAGLGFEEMVLDTLKNVRIDSGIIRGVSETIQSELVPGIKKIQSEQIRSKESRRREEIEKGFNEQLEWLKSGGVADEKLPGETQTANKKATHRDTTNWILSETKFRLWRDSFRGTLAWLSGDGGFGKSFLISTIIDHLQSPGQIGPGGRPHILYFFCRRGNEATSVGTKIFLHLLVQLYQQAATGYPGSTPELQETCSQLVEETVQKLKIEVRRNSSLVKLKSVLQPLFEDLAEAFGTTVFVIVDGLDECIDLDRGLLDALSELPVDSNIRVLVSSRPDVYRSLGRPVKFHINLNAAMSQAQILKYVKSRTKTIKGFTPKMRKRVCDKIVDQSGGSFRYASVVLDNLNPSQIEKVRFNELLDNLPSGMNDLYRQAMSSLDLYSRHILIVALRWLMCSTGRISLDLIVEELDGRWSTIMESEAEISEDDEADDSSDYADFASDTDDDDSDSFGSVGSETVEERYADGRDIAKSLLLAGREFLKFDGPFINMQHESVRDFVLEEEETLEHETIRCPDCKKRFQETIAYEAGPKEGRYIICKLLLQRLNHPKFQEEHIISRDLEDDLPALDYDDNDDLYKNTDGTGVRTELLEKSSHLGLPFRDQIMAWQGNNESDNELGEDQFGNPRLSPRYLSDRSESPRQDMTLDDRENLAKHRIAEERLDRASISSAGYYISPVTYDMIRYELTHWPSHIRDLEAQMNVEEPGTEKIDELYDELEKFLQPESPAYKAWLLKVQPQEPIDSLKSPFAVSARYGIEGLIARYLKKGYNVNERNAYGDTPLHQSCAGNSDGKGLSLLCAKGADVNAKNADRETPLVKLLSSPGTNRGAPVLLKHGANPGIGDQNGMTPLHYASQLVDTGLCRILLDHKEVDVNAREHVYGETPLHRAFRYDYPPTELLELLLEKGANVNEQDYASQAPLYEASKVGDASAVAVLLRHGAEIDDTEEIFGNTALHAAVIRSYLDVVKALVNHNASLSLKNKNGEDALTLAVKAGYLPILKYVVDLLDQKKLLVQRILQFNEQWTVLHHAVAINDYTVTKTLLDRGNPSAMVSQKDNWGRTPLHIAAEGAYVDIMLLLLDYGSDPSVKDSSDSTPIDDALATWTRPIVRGQTLPKEDYIGAVVALVEKAPDLARQPDLLIVDIETEIKTPICTVYSHLRDLKDKHDWTVLAFAKQLKKLYKVEQLLGPEKDNGPSIVGLPPTRLDNGVRESYLYGEPDYEVSEDGLDIFVPDPKGENHSGAVWSSVLSDHPVPSGTPIYYFEVEILSAPHVQRGTDFQVSYVYHSDIKNESLDMWGWNTGGGRAQLSLPSEKDSPEYSKPYGSGDVIGCVFDFESELVYFTRNGERLPIAYTNVRGRLYPSIDVGAPLMKVRMNFGNDPKRPFKFQDWKKKIEIPKGLSLDDGKGKGEGILEVSFKTLRERPLPEEPMTPMTPASRTGTRSATWRSL